MKSDFQDLSQWWLATSGNDRTAPLAPVPERRADVPPESAQMEALVRRVDAARRIY